MAIFIIEDRQWADNVLGEQVVNNIYCVLRIKTNSDNYLDGQVVRRTRKRASRHDFGRSRYNDLSSEMACSSRNVCPLSVFSVETAMALR